MSEIKIPEEIQLETPNNLQSGGLKEVKGSSIKDFFKEYKYEILLGLIILGAIVFKLWNNPYVIKQYFNKENKENKKNIVKWNQHYYINLDYRTDRKERAIKEFQKIGIKEPNRFSAIKNDNHGGIGCGLSHVSVLEKAKGNGWDYVIIMEDDIKFYDPEETVRKINNVFQSDIEWDVMLIGSIIQEPIQPINGDCARAMGGMAAAIMYIVKSHYYDTLINLWKKDMISFENEIIKNKKNMKKQNIDKIYHRYAIDQTWKHLQKKDKFITITPHKVYEHGDNKSDIWSTHYKYVNKQ